MSWRKSIATAFGKSSSSRRSTRSSSTASMNIDMPAESPVRPINKSIMMTKDDMCLHGSEIAKYHQIRARGVTLPRHITPSLLQRIGTRTSTRRDQNLSTYFDTDSAPEGPAYTAYETFEHLGPSHPPRSPYNHGSNRGHNNIQETLGTLPRGRLGPKDHIIDSTQVVVDFLVIFRKPHLRDAPSRHANHIREDGLR